MAPDRHGPAPAHERGGEGHRSADRVEKGPIEQAYREAEAAGVAVWCQDEAGPYSTEPYPGASWEPVGHPARQPHEYVRNGTAKLLTLFHPASGAGRVKGVTSAATAVLHPWLQEQLTRVLALLPPVTTPEAERPMLARWESWLGHPPRTVLPPLRLILVWDNRAGHLSVAIVVWLFQQGILPLYTPLSGSWLNLAEAWQRIIVHRALAGAHPQAPDEIITWLEETAAACNEAPTPFTWGGKRQERRQRARQRRLGGAAALVDHHSFVA